MEVRIKKSDLFIDAETFESLEPNYVMHVRLPPQVTVAEAAELEAMNDSVDGPMKYLSALQTAGNLMMAYGLKYLWNMVNLFQFLVFFENWKINISPEARIALDQFRKLAFFEFIDTSWFTKWMGDQLGIESEKKCSELPEEEQEACQEQKTEASRRRRMQAEIDGTTG